MKKIWTKVREDIKKHDNFFTIILIILAIFGVTLNVLITNSDELWNFQNIYKMYNGFEIYKDANVIITPLFFLIGKIMFNLLGANFLTFRIYNILILLPLYYITYLLLKKIEISKRISIILVLLLIILKKYLIVICQANYNIMALMLYIFGVYICFKKYKYNTIIQGIILFLIFCTKQNVGFYYAISLFLYEAFSENTIKEKIKKLAVEATTFIGALIILLVYFYLNNNLYNFINYAFLGIGEFANKNTHIDIYNFIIIISLILINLIFTILFIKNKKVKDDERQQLVILNCFSIPATLISLPIMNDTHFLLGIYLSIILFINLIKIITRDVGIKIEDKIIDVIMAALIIFVSSYSIYSFINWKINIDYIKEEYGIGEEHPFYGGLMTKETINNIEIVTNYIANNSNNVIVLSSKAAFYMVPLQRSNGIMDLPFKGNFGKEGEEGLIELIEKSENTEFLIEKNTEDIIIEQESEIVRKYIKENLEKIGEIEEFEIYINK